MYKYFNAITRENIHGTLQLSAVGKNYKQTRSRDVSYSTWRALLYALKESKARCEDIIKVQLTRNDAKSVHCVPVSSPPDCGNISTLYYITKLVLSCEVGPSDYFKSVEYFKDEYKSAKCSAKLFFPLYAKQNIYVQNADLLFSPSENLIVYALKQTIGLNMEAPGISKLLSYL